MTLVWFEIILPAGMFARRRFIKAPIPTAALAQFRDRWIGHADTPATVRRTDDVVAGQLGLLGRRSSSAVLGIAIILLTACGPDQGCRFAGPNGEATSITGYGQACRGV